MDTITKQLSERITSYLLAGGLVNPELANHSAVRDLLIDCRAALDALPLQQARQPLSEAQVVKCLVDSGCIGTVKMSFDSGPYEITRPSFNANRLVGAVEIAHGITGEQP